MARLLGVIFGTLAIVIGYMWLNQDTFNPADIRGKRVLLTGASSGIGEQMAYHYCKLGASIVIVARRESLLKQVVSKCKELHPDPRKSQISYIATRLDGQPEVSKGVIDTTLERLGGIDHLILNHALFPAPDPWQKEGLQVLIDSINVNMLAYISLATYGLPYLKESKGSIGVVSSECGKIPWPYIGPYNTAKFGLDGFFSTLRQELQLTNSNVSVTLCVLSVIGTDFIWQALSQSQKISLESVKEMYAGYIPSPEDTAMEIIKSTSTHQREMYYSPRQWVKTRVLLRHLLPDFVEAYAQNTVDWLFGYTKTW